MRTRSAPRVLLDGRRALITGGAGRLGTAIAEVLLREGAAVAVADTDGARLERLHAALPEALVLTGDVSSEIDVERLVASAENGVGPLDVLVTCAAVYPNVPVLAMATADWDRVFAVNVRGVMLASRAFAARCIARGKGGALVHLSSAAATSARRGAAAYCGSKAALDMLVDVLALELGPHGIRVNAVAPGLVMDDVVHAESPALHAYYNAQLRATPLGRTGDPNDVAEAVAFLASDRSAWTTGAVLAVTGGSHCGRSHLDYTEALGRLIAPP